ncbi:MAG: hypothetical protein KZQ58_03290 [gamma proteobacterium symbiont of Bathyaustriella thionipta]|nr:hypothetical protein [gamma proteobacterium symbiont of Bathyaustriella thionipta]
MRYFWHSSISKGNFTRIYHPISTSLSIDSFKAKASLKVSAGSNLSGNMNKLASTILSGFLCVFSLHAHAWGSLKSQNASGLGRYCTYTDGGVLTVGSTDLCPMDNSEQSKNNGSPTINIENKNVGFGSLKGQQVKGFNRYCAYSDGTVITIGSTDLCPITSK